ncbi:MAG: MFS transporter [Anaerolineales bacterium]
MIRKRTGKDIFLFSLGIGFGEFFTALLTALLNYYYVRTMGMSNWWFLFAQSVYAIYNAVNDPLIGYLTAKRYGFSERLGRNYPWIMIGGFGALLTAILVYVAPFRAELGLVLWMIITLCLADTFYSLFFVNHQALAPVIIRNRDQRRKFGAVSTVISTVSMLLGFIIPEFGDISSPEGYLIPMLIGLGIGTVMLLALRPSVREERELTEELFRSTEGAGEAGFFATLKEAMKHKNFMVFIFLFLTFQTLSLTAIASLPFFVEFVLEVPPEKVNSLKTLLILIEFVGVFLAVPAWSFVAKKKGFKFTSVICSLAIVAFSLPALFVASRTGIMAVFFLIGLGVSGFWVMIMPIFTDTVDEITLSLGEHQEGVYAGIRTFFARLALILQAVIYAVVREMTGFNPAMMDVKKITPHIAVGIRFEMIGASAVLLLIAAVIFAIIYDLEGDKRRRIREELDKQIAY